MQLGERLCSCAHEWLNEHGRGYGYGHGHGHHHPRGLPLPVVLLHSGTPNLTGGERNCTFGSRPNAFRYTSVSVTRTMIDYLGWTDVCDWGLRRVNWIVSPAQFPDSQISEVVNSIQHKCSFSRLAGHGEPPDHSLAEQYFIFASLEDYSRAIAGTDIRESDVNIVQVPCLNSVTRR